MGIPEFLFAALQNDGVSIEAFHEDGASVVVSLPIKSIEEEDKEAAA